MTEMSPSVPDLDALFRARTIAVVGAHDSKGPLDFLTKQILDRAEFNKGTFFPVNPTRPSVYGIPTIRSPRDLPDEIDALVVLIGGVADVLRDLAGKRVKFIVVWASGFSEMGTEEGRRNEAELLELAHGLGARVVGPNTNMNLFEVLRPSDRPKIGIVAQSGHQGRPLATAQKYGYGISYWVTTGNEADLRATDFIGFMAAQPDTGAVAAYIEGFRSGAGLRRAALACIEAQTPLVMVKIGRSEQGAAAALSHTGQLAGSDAVIDAFFEQTSIHRVIDLDELSEVAHAVARAGVLPPADGVAVCSASGGANAHLTDLIIAGGLTVPELSEKTQVRLRELLGPKLSVTNPVDNGGTSLLQGHGPEMIDAIMDDPAVGVLMLPVSTPLPAMARPLADLALHAFRRGDKPVIALSLMPGTDDPVFAELVEAGVPVVRNMRNAVSAARAMLNQPARRFPEGVPAALRDYSPRPVEGEATVLDEPTSLAWLNERGLAAVEHEFVRNGADALAAADRIGYPIVLKAVAPHLAHKSEHGAVIVDINNPEMLTAALDKLRARLGDADLTGYLVERFAPADLELLLGVSTDPLLGPIVMVGAGGVDAEALSDTAVSVVPFDRARAEQMLDRLRVSKLLGPWRGRSALNRGAVVDAIMAVEAVARCGEVIELDVNPLAVRSDGVQMLDALVSLRNDRTV